MTTVATVDEYLATVRVEAQAALGNLRDTIRAAAPNATEVISYQIPTFADRAPIVAYSVSRNHCSFHLLSPEVMAAHKGELSVYDTTKATIRFAVDEPLPAALVTKLVKARIAENDAAANAPKKGQFNA